jgi:hypothetical protein
MNLPDWLRGKSGRKEAEAQAMGAKYHGDGSIVGFVEEKEYDAMIPAACGVRIPRWLKRSSVGSARSSSMQHLLIGQVALTVFILIGFETSLKRHTMTTDYR